jgi:hypothetical protein
MDLTPTSADLVETLGPSEDADGPLLPQREQVPAASAAVSSTVMLGSQAPLPAYPTNIRRMSLADLISPKALTTILSIA